MTDQVLKEVAESLTTMVDNLDTLQEKQNKFSERLEKGYLDEATKNEIKQQGEKVADALQQINNIKAQQKAQEEASKLIEKSFARLGDGSGDKGQISEAEQKAKEEINGYLRKGDKGQITDETTAYILKSAMKAKAIGATEEDIEHEVKTLLAGSNQDGGYWIVPERSNDSITRSFETSPMRQIANVVTTTSDVWELPIDDDEAETGGWVGETQARNETGTPSIGMLSIALHEQYAEPKATHKMLNCVTFDAEGWLNQKTNRKLMRVENTAFVVGDGSQKPRGFLDYPAWAANGVYERGALEHRNSGVSGQFTADSIICLQNDLKEEYDPNAVFGIRRSEFCKILTLKDGQDQYLINSMILREGADKVLLGKPVVFMDDLPVAAASSKSLVYGDFDRGYTIVDKLGLRVIRDIYTDKRFIKFNVSKYVGGDVTNYEAIKVLRLA